MDAHLAALVLETPTLTGPGDRLCRLAAAGSQYYVYSGAKLRYGADSLRVLSGERIKRVAPIRSEAAPSRGDVDDEPEYVRLFRQRAPSTSSSFHQQLRSIAKSATTKTKGTWWMDKTTTDAELVDDDDSEQFESDSMYCDVLPHSLVCQYLHLASVICCEVDSQMTPGKSKKPKRLSTTSSDLLD